MSTIDYNAIINEINTVTLVKDGEAETFYHYYGTTFSVIACKDTLTITTVSTKEYALPELKECVVCALLDHYGKSKVIFNGQFMLPNFKLGTLHVPGSYGEEWEDVTNTPSKKAVAWKVAKKVAFVGGCVAVGMAVKVGVTYALSR